MSYDGDPWAEMVPDHKHCWQCAQPATNYDLFGLPWCQMHFDRDYLGGLDAPSD